MKKKVALVLASGGARGMAHIGAIEELESRGYEISSIAGTSMGALIAAIYAAGKLPEAKEWFLTIDKQKIFSLSDFSLSKSYVVRGDKIIEALKEIVPDRMMEELPIPIALVASDMIHNKEVVMSQGSLFDAVRASMSIPLFFRPVHRDNMLLVDGGLLNALPLNRVHRNEGDLLVGMNISAPDVMEIEQVEQREKPRFVTEHPLLNRIYDGLFGEDEDNAWEDSLNYLQMTSRMTDMMIQHNTVMMTQYVHADILAEMPMDEYQTFDFHRAKEIMEDGRRRMRAAIDRYEAESGLNLQQLHDTLDETLL